MILKQMKKIKVLMNKRKKARSKRIKSTKKNKNLNLKTK